MSFHRKFRSTLTRTDTINRLQKALFSSNEGHTPARWISAYWTMETPDRSLNHFREEEIHAAKMLRQMGVIPKSSGFLHYDKNDLGYLHGTGPKGYGIDQEVNNYYLTYRYFESTIMFERLICFRFDEIADSPKGYQCEFTVNLEEPRSNISDFWDKFVTELVAAALNPSDVSGLTEKTAIEIASKSKDSKEKPQGGCGTVLWISLIVMFVITLMACGGSV